MVQDTELKDEVDVKSIFTMVLMIILVFGTASVGTEVYKYYQVLSVFEDEMGNIAMDAMELAMNDAYRMEHIMVVDSDEAKQNFLVLLTNRYELSDELKPLHNIDGIKQININALDVSNGTYIMYGGMPVQKSTPQMSLQGSLEMKPLILGVTRTVKVPFDLNVNLKRAP